LNSRDIGSLILPDLSLTKSDIFPSFSRTHPHSSYTPRQIFFCNLFNYTILRDTKDVIMVSNCGAEVIPFLKTYVNLPGAIAFTVIYSKMTDKMTQKNVFRTIVLSFLAFFASFALILYPNANIIHPHALCDSLAKILPGGFAAPLGILRYWSFSLFYLMAEMWGSVVVSLLFWGFANTVTTVDEAKKYYPLFGMGANIALIFSGQYVRLVSMLRAAAAPGVDGWGMSLKLLMGGVAASGGVMLGLYEHMQRNVMTDPNCVDPNMAPKPSKKKKAKVRIEKERRTDGAKDGWSEVTAKALYRLPA